MQVRLLDWLVGYSVDQGVDVVIAAGDIYDQQSPSAQAVEALDHVLSRFAAEGIKVVGISGNHDSAVRVSFLEQVATSAGISIRGDLRKASVPVIHQGRGDNFSVAFYPIPFIEPHSARHVLESPELASHDGLLRVALDLARQDLSQRQQGQTLRSVAIVHAFVTGGAPSDSERDLCVGGSQEVGIGLFDGFDYGALGHLHGRQSLGNGSVRYSGSPMAYSFSETNHTKGGWLIDMPRSGDPVITAVDFPVERPLAKISGTLEDLLGADEFEYATPAFVQATLTDTVLPQQALEKLRRRFPYTIELRFAALRNNPQQTKFREQTRGKSDLQLGTDFLSYVTDSPPDQDTIQRLARVIDETKVDTP